MIAISDVFHTWCVSHHILRICSESGDITVGFPQISSQFKSVSYWRNDQKVIHVTIIPVLIIGASQLNKCSKPFMNLFFQLIWK